MRLMRRSLAVLLLVLLAAAPVAAARVRVPAGVELQRYAKGIPNPSNLAFDGRGRLWATSAGVQAAATDGVWLVPRRGARPRQVVSGLFSALGLTWHRRELYVSHIVPHATFAPRHTGRVVAFSGFDGRRFTRSRVVVDGLPVERHRVDSIAAGPAGRLYLGIGSESDHEPSSAELAGTVISFRPDGEALRVEARGLRNPYGLAFAPGAAACSSPSTAATTSACTARQTSSTSSSLAAAHAGTASRRAGARAARRAAAPSLRLRGWRRTPRPGRSR